MTLDVGGIYQDLQENVFRRSPMLVLGCGASAATAATVGVSFPTMEGLSGALRENVPQRLAGRKNALDEWSRCEALLDGLGLEEALHEASIADDFLLQEIVSVTAETVELPDMQFRNHVLKGDVDSFPLHRLIEYLWESAPEISRVLHILTPNYDRIVEYACFLSTIPCSTMFFDFGLKCFEPDICSKALTEVHPSERRGRRRVKPIPHVCLYKPHGSLDWFQSERGEVALGDSSAGLPRIMVTPGSTKYRASVTIPVLNRHREAGNAALKRADALMFYGYGFNDKHLESILDERLRKRAPALIIAKSLSPGAHAVAKKHPHVWAFQSAGEDATCCLHEGKEFVIGGRLWDLDKFLTEVLGR